LYGPSSYKKGGRVEFSSDQADYPRGLLTNVSAAVPETVHFVITCAFPPSASPPWFPRRTSVGEDARTVPEKKREERRMDVMRDERLNMVKLMYRGKDSY